MKLINSNCIYKIGEQLYANGDKNSGLHEYKLICNTVQQSSIKDTLIIINGKLDVFDTLELEKLFRKFKHKVFISSDAISFTTNIDIINECDILLHQCPFSKISGVKDTIVQHYSYVPELFYEPFDKVSNQDNLLFYGGGLRNERTLEYINDITSIAWLKSEKVGDNRLEYSKYIEEAKKHKFALIISRQDYIDLGWVTSRFVEAAACYNYPIVDFDYDRYQYFGMNKVLNATDAKQVIDKLSADEYSRETRINYYRNRFSKDKHKFVQLLEELIK